MSLRQSGPGVEWDEDVIVDGFDEAIELLALEFGNR